MTAARRTLFQARPPRSVMSVEKADVVIVGAGLAGLACARGLTSRGLDVLVLEAGDAVGGRVRTDHVDGYTLDRGFQVLNTGYPEVQRVVDLAALDLRPFDPAAGVRVDGERVVLANPVRRPSGAAAALGLPVGGIGGKAALGLYAGLCATLPVEGLKHRDDLSAAEAWRRASIPQDVVDGVLRPFFAGVLLEQDLSTTRRFTDLMMRMFVRGESTVPAAGMQALPEQLAAGLPAGTVRLGTPVREVAPHRVGTAAGTVEGRAVVVATDGWTAAAAAARWPDRATGPRRHHRLPRDAGLPRGHRDRCCWTPTRHRWRTRSCCRPRRRSTPRPGAPWSPPRWCTAPCPPTWTAPTCAPPWPGCTAPTPRLGARRDLRPAARPARHARAAPAAQAVR